MLNDIYIGFNNILENNEPVRFNNTYFGMPVSYSGRILKMEEGMVMCQVPRTQIVCMRRDRITYLKSNLLPNVLKAKVVRLNLRNEIAILSQFERASTQIGNRAYVRVEPASPLSAILVPENNKFTFKAQVMEISLIGVAVLLRRDAYTEKDFSKGDKVFIVFDLPTTSPDETAISIGTKGIIRNILRNDEEFNRFGIQIFPIANVETQISQYLAQRQLELLKELRRLSIQELV